MSAAANADPGVCPPAGTNVTPPPAPAAAELLDGFAAAGAIHHGPHCCPRCAATLDAIQTAVVAIAPHVGTIADYIARVRSGGLVALLKGKP